jgi:plastocyanin
LRQVIPAAAAFLPLLLFSTGCGNSTPPPEQHTVVLPEAHVDPATAGAITGRVLFVGAAPVMQTIDMSSNPSCVEEHKSRPPVHAQTIVVNPNHTLRNAFVWIKDGLPAAHWTPPAQTVELAQNGCVYEPHVAGIMVGQTLEIVNDDPINHNVHANTKINQPWNIAQAPKAEHKFRKFASPEVLFAMTCSVHPWMNSYIGVVPHPFFAVTGDDGAFTLRGVPPGTYTIEVVQEKLGKKEGTLTLPASGTASIDFTYGSQ